MTYRHYDLSEVTKDDFIKIMRDAHAVCIRWWVDELDCSKSVYREVVNDISFDEAIARFHDKDAIPIAIERRVIDMHDEIGFHTLSDVSFFLFIIVDSGFISKLGLPLKEVYDN